MIVLISKLGKLTKRKNVKLQDGRVEDIIDYLTNQSDTLTKLDIKTTDLQQKLSSMSLDMQKCMQRVGIVRFDAFDDVGGEQSFALALLDAKNNGILISNLYGRQDSRVYVKCVTDGQSERALSNEERSALEKAQ